MACCVNAEAFVQGLDPSGVLRAADRRIGLATLLDDQLDPIFALSGDGRVVMDVERLASSLQQLHCEQPHGAVGSGGTRVAEPLPAANGSPYAAGSREASLGTAPPNAGAALKTQAQAQPQSHSLGPPTTHTGSDLSGCGPGSALSPHLATAMAMPVPIPFATNASAATQSTATQPPRAGLVLGSSGLVPSPLQLGGLLTPTAPPAAASTSNIFAAVGSAIQKALVPPPAADDPADADARVAGTGAGSGTPVVAAPPAGAAAAAAAGTNGNSSSSEALEFAIGAAWRSASPQDVILRAAARLLAEVSLAARGVYLPPAPKP